ncbi:hypothetical protein TNCV_1578491 [Trichonephila clavipes]|nr:hypothetical protein TNCV_1578491 [Trichonephila clavipes]
MKVSKACKSHISQSTEFQKQNGGACQIPSLDYLFVPMAPKESLVSSQALIVDKATLAKAKCYNSSLSQLQQGETHTRARFELRMV